MSGDAGVLAVDAAVIARYRIGQVLSTQVLRGGMFLRPLLLDTTSGKYVLRAHTFRNTAEAFRFQAETLEGLAGSGQRCPRVVRDQQGCVGQSGAGVFWALHEYLEGRQYDWTGWRRAMRDAAFVRQLGARVARWHAILRTLQPGGDARLSPRLPPIQFSWLGDVFRQWRDDLQNLSRQEATSVPRSRDALCECERRIADAWCWLAEHLTPACVAALPCHLVHGDISPVNLVFEPEGSAFALIDWDCVHYGTRLYDALGDVLNRPPSALAASARYDWQEVRVYLEGYGAACEEPLSPPELRTVPAFCLARQLEDLRQRLHVVPMLAPELDHEYATLIRSRVAMLDQIRATSGEFDM